MTHIPVTAHIRNNATGEVVTMDSTCMPTEDGTPNPFWWQREQGNAGCDCNRRQFFEEAKGTYVYPEDGDDGYECGYTAYSVNLSTTDGKVFYREFEE